MVDNEQEEYVFNDVTEHYEEIIGWKPAPLMKKKRNVKRTLIILFLSVNLFFYLITVVNWFIK